MADEQLHLKAYYYCSNQTFIGLEEAGKVELSPLYPI